MKLSAKILGAFVAALVCWMMLAGATTAPVSKADKLLIISTTDVKGKTSPCG